jgi:hypothetical protein
MEEGAVQVAQNLLLLGYPLHVVPVDGILCRFSLLDITTTTTPIIICSKPPFTAGIGVRLELTMMNLLETP